LAGLSNTGGGGGGASQSTAPYNGAAGGSGIVILKYAENFNLSTSVGLISSTSQVNGYKVTTITAGTGTVTFS
jgi:hypothetical protein